MSEDINQAHAHGLLARWFHAGDVRDRRDVVVVEAVAEAQDAGGKQSQIQRVQVERVGVNEESHASSPYRIGASCALRANYLAERLGFPCIERRNLTERRSTKTD